MSGIKIRLVEIDGEKRVPPECMRLLREYAKHRDACKRCFRAYHQQSQDWCDAGRKILTDLAAQPEVEPIEPEKGHQ
jgi:hypothetical protein